MCVFCRIKPFLEKKLQADIHYSPLFVSIIVNVFIIFDRFIWTFRLFVCLFVVDNPSISCHVTWTWTSQCFGLVCLFLEKNFSTLIDWMIKTRSFWKFLSQYFNLYLYGKTLTNKIDCLRFAVVIDWSGNEKKKFYL